MREAAACFATLASASEQTKKSAASIGSGSRSIVPSTTTGIVERAARRVSAGTSPLSVNVSGVHALCELAKLAPGLVELGLECSDGSAV